jgi:hypothetical protein
MTDKSWQKDILNLQFNVESKFEIKMGPFHLKKTKMASISGTSGSVTILRKFYLNLEQSIIVDYQFSY